MMLVIMRIYGKLQLHSFQYADRLSLLTHVHMYTLPAFSPLVPKHTVLALRQNHS